MMDPLDIDSGAFDPQKYVTHFLRNHSIQELIRKNNQVQQEIKNYDQEIQSLVFQNYSRFISSIDTVKKMKNDIFKVDDKMKVLEESMNRVTTLSTKVDDALNVKRSQIQKLNTIKLDLEKLNMLCLFPKILAADLQSFRNMIDTSEVIYADIFSKTVEGYKECFKKLDEFQEEPLVKPIFKDSIDKVEEIRSILWKIQNSFKYHSSILPIKPSQNQPGVVNTVELRQVTFKLTQIMQDQESVLRNYLKIVKERFSQMTIDIVNQALNFSYSAQNPNQTENTVLSQYEKLEAYLVQKKYTVSLEELSQFYKRRESEVVAIEINQKGSIIWMVNYLIEKVFLELKTELHFLLSQLCPVIHNFQQKEDVVEQTVREIFLHIIEEIKKQMSKKITDIEVSECFRLLSACFQEVIFSNSLLKRPFKTSVSDKFCELSEKVCRGQILNCFTNLRNEFVKLLISAKEQCFNIEQESITQTKLQNDFAETESSIYREITGITSSSKNKLDCLVQWTCLQLKSFLFSETQYLRIDEMLIGLLHSQMVDFVRLVYKFLTLRPNFISLESLALLNNLASSSQQMKETNPAFLELLKQFQAASENTLYFLFANQFLIIYENKLISKIFEVLLKTHQPPIIALSRSQPGLKEFYENEIQQIQIQIIPKLKQACQQEHSLNYVNYSQALTEQILAYLNNYFLNADKWKNNDSASPSEVSKEISGIAEGVRQILLELDLFFLDSKRGLAKKGSFLKLDSGVMIEMERMIAKKSRVFDMNKLDFNRNSLLMAILKGLLKALIERVRKIRCLSKNGLQQLQCDLYFLVQVFYEMVSVDDESFVIATYFEMLESAKDSAVEILLLEATVVEGISSSKRAQLKI